MYTNDYYEMFSQKILDKARTRLYNHLCCLQQYADVAELADALDLGSSAAAWGFESLHPHQLCRRELIQ